MLWCLKLVFHAGFGIADHRDFIVPGNTIVRLVVGADDAEAREYDVRLFWDGTASTSENVLDSIKIEILDSRAF